MQFSTFIIKNLLRRRVRSALTCVGVAIAVATMVALLGVADAIERQMLVSFEGRGVDIVVLAEGMPAQLSSEVPQSTINQIRALPGVDNADGGLLEMITIIPPGESGGGLSGGIMSIVQGWSPDSFLFDDLTILAGERFGPEDDRQIMVGETMARNLKLGVGDVLEFEEEQFTVCGVFKSFTVFEDGAGIVPLATFQEIMFKPGVITGVSVSVDKANLPAGGVDKVCQQINELTNDEGKRIGLTARSTESYVANSEHIKWANAIAWMTSVIAVTAGLVGMANTMVMAVMERVKEISILRAIGWRKSRVMRMILGESMIIGVAGAVLGAVAAIGVVKWLATQPQARNFLDGNVSPGVVVQGFLMAFAVGVLGGVYPAWQATRLMPSEGLRHE